MKNRNKRVLLIVPSVIVATGLKEIIGNSEEFSIAGVLPDLSRNGLPRLRNIGADLVIVDPEVFDYSSRRNARSILSQYTDAAVIALLSTVGEEFLQQYDDVIRLHDEPSVIISIIRKTFSEHSDLQKPDGEELSMREKEILVCVAKGMLNKEIADLFNISIYTVITHRKNITRKIGIKTVAGLTVYALLNNLIDMKSME